MGDGRLQTSARFYHQYWVTLQDILGHISFALNTNGGAHG